MRAFILAVDVVFDSLLGLISILSPKKKEGNRTPKRLKSIAITTTVSTQATNATKAPRIDPTTPAPALSAKARNAMAHAMGCRIITFVSPSTLSAAARLNTVP